MSKLKNTILGIAIAIIFFLFVAYAIEAFYEKPEYTDYCEEFKTAKIVETQIACDEIGGKWTPYSEIARPIENQPVPQGYCDIDFTCREEWQSVLKVRDRNIFFIATIIGLITVVVAVLLKKESVSSGLMASGVFLIIYGTVRYWGDLSDVLRTLMLGLALAILIWLGYRKLPNSVKK